MAEDRPRLDDSIDSLVAFLPIIGAEDFSSGHWVGREVDGEVVAAPKYHFSDEMNRFVAALNDGGWMVPFDWPAWQDEAQKYVDSPDSLKDANIKVLMLLLTTHVRKDKFCEGHLAEMIETGHIAAILKRLKQIREKAA